MSLMSRKVPDNHVLHVWREKCAAREVGVSALERKRRTAHSLEKRNCKRKYK